MKTRKASFWEGETCEYCQGSIPEREVEVTQKVKDKYILIKHVPAGVCQSCGTRYYSANVLKTIAETARGRRRSSQELIMKVYNF